MDAVTRIERVLGMALAETVAPGGPPLLAAAMHHAVFPRGARIRSRLCLAVAAACGDDAPDLADAAAGSIELLHCASLVHDDLPCFDNAETRRGKPSVHRQFGAPLAVLAGDALIVLAFQLLAMNAHPQRLGALVGIVARSVGMPNGICAGQAWECEPTADLAEYQRAKTGALFAAATMAGAAAAGADAAHWRALGAGLGEAYQVADDIGDAYATPDEIGKPVGQDKALGRPNAVLQLGFEGAMRRLEELTNAAADSIPACPGAAELRALTRMEARRLLPKELARSAA